MLTTTNLGEAVGVQHAGLQDRTATSTVQGLTHGLIIGKFRRGRTDQPMRINKDNIRARLGYEPANPFYQVVQDCLDKFPSVWVLRVAEVEGQPNYYIEFADGASIVDASNVIITGSSTGNPGDNIELTITSGDSTMSVLTNVIVSENLTFTTSPLDLSGFLPASSVNATVTKVNGVTAGFKANTANALISQEIPTHYVDLDTNINQNVFTDPSITYRMEVNGVAHYKIFSETTVFYQYYNWDPVINKLIGHKYYSDIDYTDSYMFRIRFKNPSYTEPLVIKFIPDTGIPTGHNFILASNPSIDLDPTTGILTITLNPNPSSYHVGRAYVKQPDPYAVDSTYINKEMALRFTVDGVTYDTVLMSTRGTASDMLYQVVYKLESLTYDTEQIEFGTANSNNLYQYYMTLGDDALMGLEPIPDIIPYERTLTLVNTGVENDVVAYLFGETIELKTFADHANPDDYSHAFWY